MNKTEAQKAVACGVLMVDKPSGKSSHDIVYMVRKMTGIKKVGHGGTLDPFATGLLLMLVGKATRLFDFLAPLIKEYRVTAQFGSVSSTGDIDGEIRVVGCSVDEDSLRRILPGFKGKIQQKVPAYSAVKVDGVALYKKARAGITVESPVREVEIISLELVSFDSGSQQAVLDVVCSKGTYIRQLCEDMGEVLETGAYAAALRRNAVGEMRIEQASSVRELEEMPRESLLSSVNTSFISCLGALYFLPVRELDEKEARAVTCGRPIDGEYVSPVRLARDGRLLAIYGPDGDAGIIRPLVVLA
ncbi:MAG: tRNA pseudouridine(55) synthase TruB [Thermoleophilia bacterium]